MSSPRVPVGPKALIVATLVSMGVTSPCLTQTSPEQPELTPELGAELAVEDVPLQLGRGSDHAGNLFFQETDLELPSNVGPPLLLRRSYNSRSRRTGLFGRGWTADPLDIRIVRDADGRWVLIAEDGHEEVYTPDGESSYSVEPCRHRVGRRIFIVSGQIVLLRVDGGRWTFNSKGLLISKADAMGNELTVERDLDGVMPLNIRGPFGRTVRITTKANRVTSVEGPGASRAVFFYDDHGQLVGRVGPSGHQTTYAYDSRSMLTRHEPLGGPARRFSFRRGLLSELSVEGYGSLILRYVPLSPAEPGSYRQSSIDSSGTVLKAVTVRQFGRSRTEQDALGNLTQLLFDDQWRLVARRGPIGQQESWTYDDAGSLALYQDARGNRTSFRWVVRGETLVVTDPRGARTTYQFRLDGVLVGMIDRWGARTRYERDERGRVTGIIYNDMRVLSQSYDENGLLSRAEGVHGSYGFERDATGHVTKILDGEGGVTVLRSDLFGRPMMMDDGEGRLTRWSYDEHGRWVAVTNGQGHSVRFSLTDAGRLATFQDRNQNRYGFTFERDELTRLTFPDGSFEHLEIDRSSRPVRRTDRRGQV
ncbi:MAG: RHS repeat protein, partial [Acidobacteriota bacterium]